MADYKNSDPTDLLGQEIKRKAMKAFDSTERNNAQKTWATLSEFVLPTQNRGWFGDVSKGTRTDRRTFDSTAQMASRDLAAAMHSTITNPTMKWSKFRYEDDTLNKDKEAIQWLDDASDAFHDRLNTSNFDKQIGKGYQSMCALAIMILFQEEDFTFTAWHLAETALVENDKGMIDTAYRKFKMTLKQAYDKFGDKIGEDMVEKLEKEPLMELDFYHAIYPRNEKDVTPGPQALAKERAIASCYVMSKGNRIVHEDGFYEFPLFVGRWSQLPGETYGFGPGHIALADIRSLNKIQEEDLKAQVKAGNPPIITTQNNMILGDFRPGGQTLVRDMNGFKEFITQARFDVTIQKVERLQQSIKSAFYIDKLLLPPRTETGEMTAYEVAQRLEQVQQILGPVLSGLNIEFLQPLVMRSLNILVRTGKLRPAPPSVAAHITKGNGSIDFEIIFVNSLARAQQLSELRNVQQWLQETVQFASFKPEVLDNLNTDAILEYTAKIRDIPENLTLDVKEVKKIRDQRQQQAQTQQALAAGQQVGDMAKNLGQASAATQPK